MGAGGGGRDVEEGRQTRYEDTFNKKGTRGGTVAEMTLELGLFLFLSKIVLLKVFLNILLFMLLQVSHFPPSPPHPACPPLSQSVPSPLSMSMSPSRMFFELGLER